MKIERIYNQPVDSNCYVISQSQNKDCIVVDPGTESNTRLCEYLKINRLNIEAVILTHEHYDHIAGVNNLTLDYSFRLICTETASIRISNTKANFSEYMEGYNRIKIERDKEKVEDDEKMTLGNIIFKFYHTPGHSPGSLCFVVENNVFTGDTILGSIKVPLKIPGANKDHHKNSIEKLKGVIHPGMLIYPGHGDAYHLKNQSFWTLS